MDKFKVGLQYWIPQHGLTRLMGKLASAKAGGLTTAVIRWFIKQYNVNMDEAKHSDPKHFKTFNEFFVRELKEGARQFLKAKTSSLIQPTLVLASLALLKMVNLSKQKVITSQHKNCWAVTRIQRTNLKMVLLPHCIYLRAITTVYTCHVTALCAK